MTRIIKSGPGWRLGWDAAATDFKALVGTDDWALELTAAELTDLCRFASQLADTMHQMQQELMPEEAIACEVESDLIWLAAEGFPHAYDLHLILLTGRGGEGRWAATVIPELLQAMQLLNVF